MARRERAPSRTASSVRRMPKDTTTRFQGVYARHRKGCAIERGLEMLMQALLLGQGMGSRRSSHGEDGHARCTAGGIARAKRSDRRAEAWETPARASIRL